MKKTLISLFLSLMIAPVFAQQSIDRTTPVNTVSSVHKHHKHHRWHHHKHHVRHHWMKHVQKPTITIPETLKHDRATHADSTQVKHDLHAALQDYHVRTRLMKEQLHEDRLAHNHSRVITDLHVLKQIQMQEQAIKQYAHMSYHHKHGKR